MPTIQMFRTQKFSNFVLRFVFSCIGIVWSSQLTVCQIPPPTATPTPKTNCSSITMTCYGPVSVGEDLICEASVSTKDVDYKWTNSAGNITSGQSTSRITIANLPSGG